MTGQPPYMRAQSAQYMLVTPNNATRFDFDLGQDNGIRLQNPEQNRPIVKVQISRGLIGLKELTLLSQGGTAIIEIVNRSRSGFTEMVHPGVDENEPSLRLGRYVWCALALNSSRASSSKLAPQIRQPRLLSGSYHSLPLGNTQETPQKPHHPGDH